MQALTLDIISPKSGALEPIRFNFEELKTQIANIVAGYKDISYTDEQIKTAKADLATLRKFKNAIDAKRKDVKKRWTEPLAKFEDQIHELTGMVDEPINLIDQQVKAYGQKCAEEKIARCREYFEAQAKEMHLDGILSWQHVEQKNFANVTMTEDKIKDQIMQVLERAKQDWERLSRDQNNPYQFEMKDAYLQRLSLADALDKEDELKRQAERKAEFERQQAEQRARQKALQAATAEQQAVPADHPDDIAETIEEQQELRSVPKKEQNETIYTVKFSVSGSRDQLISLADYMRNNDIHFEKI